MQVDGNGTPSFYFLEHLTDDESTHLVVKGSRCDQVALQTLDTDSKGCRIADRDQLLGLLGIGTADIDELLVKLDYRLPVFGLHEMNRLFANYPQHRSTGTMNKNPLSRHQMGVDATDGRKVEKPIFVDVAHHETDFVAVTGEHDPRSPFRASQAGNDIAHHIGMQLVGHLAHFTPTDALSRLLKTRGAWRFHQLF